MIMARNRVKVENVIDSVVNEIKEKDMVLSEIEKLIEKEYSKVRKNISWKNYLELVNKGLFFGGIA